MDLLVIGCWIRDRRFSCDRPRSDEEVMRSNGSEFSKKETFANTNVAQQCHVQDWDDASVL